MILRLECRVCCEGKPGKNEACKWEIPVGLTTPAGFIEDMIEGINKRKCPLTNKELKWEAVDE